MSHTIRLDITPGEPRRVRRVRALRIADERALSIGGQQGEPRRSWLHPFAEQVIDVRVADKWPAAEKIVIPLRTRAARGRRWRLRAGR